MHQSDVHATPIGPVMQAVIDQRLVTTPLIPINDAANYEPGENDRDCDLKDAAQIAHA
jgi:hypothetical protein